MLERAATEQGEALERLRGVGDGMCKGFLAREGLRSSEAAGLTWADVDLERGAIALDENKTDDPRSWALAPGTVAAFTIWNEMERAKPTGAVFARVSFDHLAKRFRELDLKAANVTRAELFERSASRRPIRVHDLRATFITLALANGETETWVADRTGHRSSDQINGYRRAARKMTSSDSESSRRSSTQCPSWRSIGGAAANGRHRQTRSAKKMQIHLFH